MADAGIIVDIGEMKRRVLAIETDNAEDRREWKEYLARTRRETCAAPGEVSRAIEVSESRTDVKLAKIDGKLRGSIAQNWILMGSVAVALAKLFGVFH
jgi:hypothetical protein